GSTIPVKFQILSKGVPVTTGIHTLQVIKYSNSTTSDPAIDASPTDAATSGNQFRLTDGSWHFNLSTKGGGYSAGTWMLVATLADGTTHTVWIGLKK
ncbi:MAG: PxKF domain-containing protein, partial [Opitutus sp.]